MIKLFWEDALKKAASLGGTLLRRNKGEGGKPLSEDGQAFDPSKGYGGQGQAGERVSVGNGSDPGGVPPDEEKQGQEIERTWLGSKVTQGIYVAVSAGRCAPEGGLAGWDAAPQNAKNAPRFPETRSLWLPLQDSNLRPSD